MAEAEEQWVTLARLVRPQGRRGEVLADLFTDFPNLFALKSLVLRDQLGRRRATEVENHWMPTGKSAGRVVLKLRGIDSISDAEELAQFEVQMPVEERVALDDLTYYVSDLEGCQLLDRGTAIGTVMAVEFPVNADGRRLEDSAPLFAVARVDGTQALIPFVNAFVERIDTGAKQIRMTLPDGLADLNG